MKYDIGDEVVLRDDLVVGRNYANGAVVFISEMEEYLGNKMTIKETDYDEGTYYTGRWIISDDMIDHGKTAELHKGTAMGGLTAKEATENAVRKISAVNDMLNNPIQPAHYQANGKDLIEMWKDKYSEQSFRDGMRMLADRYFSRYENKNGIEDLFKGIEVINRLIEWEESLDD